MTTKRDLITFRQSLIEILNLNDDMLKRFDDLQHDEETIKTFDKDVTSLTHQLYQFLDKYGHLA